MRRFLLAAALAAASQSACSSKAPAALGSAELATLGGGRLSLASCPTEKCLNVYLAPWCGYCRAATPAILELREHLKARGVATRVVIGMDKLESVTDYARLFGGETALDPANAVGVSGGVPHFYVTDRAGKILRDVPGMPRTETVSDLAAFFGLP